VKRSRASLAITWLALGIGACSDSPPSDHWVGTWSNGLICFRAATLLGLPASTRFDDQSIRMIAHTSLGGDQVRVRISNRCATTPLEIGAASIGLRDDTAAGIRPESARALRFDGLGSAAIPPGSTLTSDPVDLALPALADLAITLYLPSGTLPETSHPQGARGYVSGTGDFTGDTAGTGFPTATAHWFFLEAVEVLASPDAAAIVAFGDSVTEGTGTTFDANHRWPDLLAERLAGAGLRRGVLNVGINGNKVLNSLLGDAALVRFDRDALDQAGVKTVILLEGINDIGLGDPDVSAEQVIAGDRQLIDRAHARGVAILGGTLTPAEGNPYDFYRSYDESKRIAVNRFIREAGAFDGVVDFAAAVEDPARPSRWAPGLSMDALHPTDAGARLLADAVDLELLR
jgi:lysophospholipase L1-like esterase